MFTLKFIRKASDSGPYQEYLMSVSEYTKTKYEDSISVNVSMNEQLFEMRLVSDPVDDNEFDVCFVENQAGKTIDRIGHAS